MRPILSQSIELCRLRQKINSSLCILNISESSKIYWRKCQTNWLYRYKNSCAFFVVVAIYKIASSSARVNVVCESCYALAYKLQLVVVAVQIL